MISPRPEVGIYRDFRVPSSSRNGCPDPIGLIRNILIVPLPHGTHRSRVQSPVSGTAVAPAAQTGPEAAPQQVAAREAGIMSGLCLRSSKAGKTSLALTRVFDVMRLTGMTLESPRLPKARRLMPTLEVHLYESHIGKSVGKSWRDSTSSLRLTRLSASGRQHGPVRVGAARPAATAGQGVQATGLLRRVAPGGRGPPATGRSGSRGDNGHPRHVGRLRSRRRWCGPGH
jgi:hypothetical protein